MGDTSYRLGFELETLGGVVRDKQPGSIDPRNFRDLVNGRFRPSGVGPRGGKVTYNPDSQLLGCPTGIFPAESTPRSYTMRVALMGTGSEGMALYILTDGAAVEIFSDAVPMNKFVYGLRFVPGPGAGGFPGQLSVGAAYETADAGSRDAFLYGLGVNDVVTVDQTYDPDSGNDSGFVSPAVPFDGELFFCTSMDQNGVTLRARVYRDPASPVSERESTSGAQGHVPMWLVASDTHLACPLSESEIHHRDLAGTWATASMPIGAQALRNSINRASAYQGNIYFTGIEVGGAYAIFEFSGSVATVHTLPGAPAGNGPMCSHGGVLYYGWSLVGGGSGIGKRSPTGSFSDNVHDFGGVSVIDLISHDGRLWALTGSGLWSAEFPDDDASWALEGSGAWQAMALAPLELGPVTTTVQQDNYVTTNEPQVYRNEVGSHIFEGMGIPAGVDSYAGARCDSFEFQLRRIFVGPFSRALVSTPGKQLVTIGITAPSVAPTLAATGGGTLTGNHIGYYAWLHHEDGQDIHESDLSPGSATVTLSGAQQRQWTLPVTGAEARVTHLRLYASVDGAIPKFVQDVPYGTASVTEGTATTALGDPPPVDTDGNLLNARGVPPYAQFCTKWKNRGVYGPDPEFPYRFWMSEPDEPESVGPLNFFDLIDRESLTLLRKAGDDLVCTGAHVLYTLTGYDEADFFMRKVSDAVGCINVFAAVLINEILWFPGQLGIWCYVPGGTLRYMLGNDVSGLWEEQYKAAPSIFERSIAINDRQEHVYMLNFTYGTPPCDRRWIGSYRDIDPAMGGQGPMRWTFDQCDRPVSTLGILLGANSLRYEPYSGSCDGWIRKENQYDNDDDDGDTGLKTLVLESGHFMPKRGQGADADGCVFQKLDVFFESEERDWTLELRCGDDKAFGALAPTKAYPVRASTRTRGGRVVVPKSTHSFTPLVSGAGLTLKIIQPRAKGSVYAGRRYVWAEGLKGRART